jgi:hypothetical protein
MNVVENVVEFGGVEEVLADDSDHGVDASAKEFSSVLGAWAEHVSKDVE